MYNVLERACCGSKLMYDGLRSRTEHYRVRQFNKPEFKNTGIKRSSYVGRNSRDKETLSLSLCPGLPAW